MPKGIPKDGKVNIGWFKKGQRPSNYSKIEKECLKCKNKFLASLSADRKYCSIKCGKIGNNHSEETKRKMSISRKGRMYSEETIKKMSLSKTGIKNHRWNPNREEVRYDRRNDPEYKQWRKKVWLRDGFKCKIENKECIGRIEAHHILPWRDYVDSRYIINNGITLCQLHHPRKRVDEERLMPFFLSMVEVK